MYDIYMFNDGWRRMDGHEAPAACGFVEVVAQAAPSVSSPEWIDCYVLTDIDPKLCGALVRGLNAVLPLRGGTNDVDTSILESPSMDHLKRIKRRHATVDEIHNRKPIAMLVKKGESMKSTMESDNGVEENSNADDHGQGELSSTQHPAKKARKMKDNAKCQTKKESDYNSQPYSLDVLVGSAVAVDHYLTSRSRSLSSETKTPLSLIFERHDYVQQSLPGRPARSRNELNLWNATIWPTLFFKEKTEKFKEEQLALTPDEVTQMKVGMSEAIKDATIGRQQWADCSRRRLQVEQRELMIDPILVCGAVVMNPANGAIIFRAADERRLQGIILDGGDWKNLTTNNDDAVMSTFPDEVSPLCTSVLLAIQGVSRQERHAALGCGMESKEFQKGQVSQPVTMRTPTILNIMAN